MPPPSPKSTSPINNGSSNNNNKVNEPFALFARHIGGMQPDPIGAPLHELEAILAHEASLLFRAFTADTAFALGTHLRNRLHAISPKPAVINITLANNNQLLFHACTHPGVTPDNDFWVARKRKTVLRFGCSSWAMGRKFGGDEKKFAEKYGLGNTASEYSIHGGAVPVRVEGVEGIVAVVVVSGLTQEEDHQSVVEGLEDCRHVRITLPKRGSLDETPAGFQNVQEPCTNSCPGDGKEWELLSYIENSGSGERL